MDATMLSEIEGLRVHITGVVQGVGFRPFVYNLARRYELVGWVRNSRQGSTSRSTARQRHWIRSSMP